MTPVPAYVSLSRALKDTFGVHEKNGAAFLSAGMVRIDGYVFREPKIEARRVRGRTLSLQNKDGSIIRGPVRPWGEAVEHGSG